MPLVHIAMEHNPNYNDHNFGTPPKIFIAEKVYILELRQHMTERETNFTTILFKVTEQTIFFNHSSN